MIKAPSPLPHPSTRLNLKSLLCIGLLTGLVPALGIEVFTNDFSGPDALSDFSHDNGAELSSSVGNPLPSLELNDSSPKDFPTAYLSASKFASAFDTSRPSTNTMIISFDWNIASFLNAQPSSAANPRFLISNDSEAESTWLTLGFGRRGGYSTGTSLFFYLTSDPNTRIPTAGDSVAMAIGYDATSATWESGAFFGKYASGTATENNTDGWVHFELTYVDQASTITGVMTHGDDTVTFTWQVPPASFDRRNTSLRFYSGSNAESLFYVDNINVTVGPKPSTAP